MLEKIKLNGDRLSVSGKDFDLSRFTRVVVMGGGKAAMAMAETIDRLLDTHVTAGLVNVPQWVTKKRVGRIVLHRASHPLPSANGVKGVLKMFELVGRPSSDTLVLCLISGGGSALMPLPRDGVKLSDKIATTKLLLKAGATIQEINIVRKHLSGIKGGWLARKLHPCTVVALVLSDVVGNALDSIASGPLYPDESTFGDALAILKTYRLEHEVPEDVADILKRGNRSMIAETPKQGEKCFDRVYNFVIGSNLDACEAAVSKLESLHRRPLYLTSSLEGEARYAGIVLASVARGILNDLSGRGFLSLVAGGETTVSVTGTGRGGRNQEAALAASLKLKNSKDIVMAFIGTDGVDGPTEAAGAIVDGSTIRRATRRGIDARDYLIRNDSNSFFRELGDIIVTGPTGTNVNDLAIACLC